MSEQPFFSIILPTKGRHWIWKYAISSLCTQTFKDFEVIFVDNDDGVETANNWFNIAYLLDSRFKYYRTGGLNMPDNWEYGLSKARGRFIYVLEDKGVLVPWALEQIYSLLTKQPCDSLVFLQSRHDFGPQDKSAETRELPAINFNMQPVLDMAAQSIPANDVIALFCNHGWNGIHDYIPRSINSVVSGSLVEVIKKRTGRFFHNLSPDFSSGLLTLDAIKEVQFLRYPLISFFMTAQLSGGWRARANFKSGLNVLYSWGREALQRMERTPCRYLPGIHNGLTADFIAMRDLSIGDLSSHSIPMEKYFAWLLGDINELEQSAGEDLSHLKALVQRSFGDFVSAGRKSV
jgi:glycosyltransferase involved in cell wall biosynthesis